MILLQQQYRSADAARQAELDRAGELNRASGLFAEIVAVDGALKRWTFADLLALAAERFQGEVCVIANSDISFDESLAPLGSWIKPHTLVALARWDDGAAPSMEGRVDPRTWRFYSQSQDTWVFRAGALPAFRADFALGVPRCENRFAYEAATAGVAVLNPALSIRSWHHHATNVRSWKRGDHYEGPLYFPQLTTLEAREAEGFVLERAGWQKREWIASLNGGTPARLTLRPLGPPSGSVWPKIGLRWPIYRRN
ncbi:MAG: hypothetical protein ACKOBP_02795 [Planctomycetia bacterium]